MDYKAQVLTAFQDHRNNKFDEKQLHLKLEQIHNELQANLIWGKRLKTMVDNCNRASIENLKSARDARSNAHEAVKNPDKIASTTTYRDNPMS